MIDRHRKLVAIYALFIVIYMAVSVTRPTDAATLHTYHLSVTVARLLTTSVVVPLAGIWTISLYCYFILKDYAFKIRRDRDGKYFNDAALGFLMLIMQFPLNGVVMGVFDGLAHYHHSWHNPLNVLLQYISLVLPVIGFIFISRAAWGLTRMARAQISFRFFHLAAALAIALTAFYGYTLVRSQNPVIHNLPADNGTFLLQTWLGIVTIMIPICYSWFIGIFALFQLFLYQRHIKGVLYKKALRWFSAGMTLVIICSVGVQFIQSLGPLTSRLSLSGLLVFVYCLLFILAIGAVIVARGVGYLRALEEI